MQKLFDDDSSFDFISLKRLSTSYLENNVTDRIELVDFQQEATGKLAI